MSTLSKSASGTLRQQSRDKDKKDDSFWEKFGTLGKKKKNDEVEEVLRVVEEGKDAIDSPGSPIPIEINPEDCQLVEGEERDMVAPETREDRRVKEVIRLLIDWVNDVVADERIVVKDIEEDFFDGQVIQKLIENLAQVKIEVPEVSQSSDGQREKLKVVLQACNQILARPNWEVPKWTAEAIHQKNLVATLHLLVALALHFKAPIRFPENVTVNVIAAKMQGGKLHVTRYLEQITESQTDLGLRGVKDAFDTMIEHAPEKVADLKRGLVTFANKYLNRINLEVTDLNTQFHDGVYLVLLMGLLNDYFVPLYDFHLTPANFDQKVNNVVFAFELMQDAGLPKPASRPEDIVNQDLRCTLRVLYNLFHRYKHI